MKNLFRSVLLYIDNQFLLMNVNKNLISKLYIITREYRPGVQGISWLQLVSRAPPAMNWIQCLIFVTRAYTPWLGQSEPKLTIPICANLEVLWLHLTFTFYDCVPPLILLHNEGTTRVSLARVFPSITSTNVVAEINIAIDKSGYQKCGYLNTYSSIFPG